jgi:hypothetical protein
MNRGFFGWLCFVGLMSGFAVACGGDSKEFSDNDDETGGIRQLGRSEATGVPLLGHQPFGLAVDPDAVGTARLWVGSFGESYVTPIDVPLAAPENADFAGGSQRKITGGTP